MKDQIQGYFEALLASVTINVIVPLVMFFTMMLMFLWVLFRAQRSGRFDASQFLRDDQGALSSMRLFAFVALSVHTWVMAVLTVNEKMNENHAFIYALTWSGSLVLSKFADKWNGVLPWSKV